MSPLRIRVERIDALTPAIRRLHLVAADGGPLPGFTAGAHIGVHVPLSPRSQRRAYSLVNAGGRADSIDRYEIAVLHAAAGSGGSQWMHACAPGDEFDIDPPRNDFPLVAHARRHLLVAGGIGITPILSMAYELLRRAQPFRLLYFVRDDSSIAFAEELAASPLAPHVRIFSGLSPPQSAAAIASALDVDTQPARDVQVYTCGPGAFMNSVVELAQARFGAASVHQESFSLPPPGPSTAAFVLRLVKSRRDIAVAADQTALASLQAAGIEIDCSCEVGVCGTCRTVVTDGVPEHHDAYLSAAEKLANNCFMPCVSRAATAVLSIDL